MFTYFIPFPVIVFFKNVSELSHRAILMLLIRGLSFSFATFCQTSQNKRPTTSSHCHWSVLQETSQSTSQNQKPDWAKFRPWLILTDRGHEIESEFGLPFFHIPTSLLISRPAVISVTRPALPNEYS